VGQGGSGGLTGGANGNIVLTGTQTAGLAPLDFYGGTTKTHALLNANFAVDKGKTSLAPSADQRGRSRPFDSPNAANGIGGSVDIGAYEADNSTIFTVRSLVDRLSATATTDDLSLREALSKSQALHGVETIKFDAAIFAHGPGTILLTYDGPDSGSAPDTLTANSVNLIGPGADLLTISGGGAIGVLSGGNLLIEGITLTGGNASYGGAIISWGNLDSACIASHGE
jgi:hypothetical protein